MTSSKFFVFHFAITLSQSRFPKHEQQTDANALPLIDRPWGVSAEIEVLFEGFGKDAQSPQSLLSQAMNWRLDQS